MENNSESFLCPQITAVIIAVLHIYFAISSSSYINSGVYLSPIIFSLIAVFVILGIKNKNYGFYNCAQITCIVISVLQTIFIVFLMVVASTDEFEKELKRQGYDPNSVKPTLYIEVLIALFFVWLESCVLICYNQRVRAHCENAITVNRINNGFNQALV